MTLDEAHNMLKAKLECLKRETSGTDFDCNNSNCDECSLCYEQGNMGEQKEALDIAIQALEQESMFDKIRADVIARYPKNYAGEPELGGSACEFSLNQILQIVDKYMAERGGEE